MLSFSWHRRLLPFTFVFLALLFVDKAVGLAREAVAKDALSAVSATPTAIPASDTAPGLGAGHQAVTAPPCAAFTPVELALLQNLKARRKQLDDKERLLDQRNELLQLAEEKLQSKLGELNRLKSQLQDLDQARQERAEQNWGGLVKMYEDMKSSDAAAIFNVLDMSVSLEVLDRMDVRKAAAILSGMSPERARVVTQMLALRRTRQDAANTVTTALADK